MGVLVQWGSVCLKMLMLERVCRTVSRDRDGGLQLRGETAEKMGKVGRVKMDRAILSSVRFWCRLEFSV